MDVAVQAIAFKEPDLSGALDAWAEQQVPAWANISYEAWVTPDGPKQACGTWKQAENHPLFEAVEAPQYKLRARNAAHSDAVARGADVIVTADADAHPLTGKTLTALLSRHKDKSNIACVCANPVAPSTPVGLYSNIGVYAKEAIGGIHGQCHALAAGAWRHAGPFSDDVDHTELKSVWMEEEYRFGHRLREWGEVAYAFDAPVFNDTRRRECAWKRAGRRELDPYCEKPEGTETFEPRKPS